MWFSHNSFYRNGKYTIEYENYKSSKKQYCLENNTQCCCKNKTQPKCWKNFNCTFEAFSSIVGTVFDECGFPMANVTIKLINLSRDTTRTVVSDKYGYFYFDNVELCEKLLIYGIDKYGNKSNEEEIVLFDTCPKTVNLFINSNSCACCNSIIVGDVFNCSDNSPIENITVTLFKKNGNGDFDLDFIVYTNKYGQFAFTDICIGEYLVKTSTIGYKPKVYNVCIDRNSQIVNLQICLTEDYENQNGTVSGLITDNNNNPVEYADVILYRVENTTQHQKLIPIAFTKTNPKGVYLFTNVSKGTYIIKATKTIGF